MVDPGEGTSWVSKKCGQIWKMMWKQQGQKLGNHGKKTQKKHGDPKV